VKGYPKKDNFLSIQFGYFIIFHVCTWRYFSISVSCAFIFEMRMKQGTMEMVVNRIELFLKFLFSLVSNGSVVKFYDHKILAFYA